MAIDIVGLFYVPGQNIFVAKGYRNFVDRSWLHTPDCQCMDYEEEAG